MKYLHTCNFNFKISVFLFVFHTLVFHLGYTIHMRIVALLVGGGLVKVNVGSLVPTLGEDPFPLLTALVKSVEEKCKDLDEGAPNLFGAHFAETDDVEKLIKSLESADSKSIEEICKSIKEYAVPGGKFNKSSIMKALQKSSASLNREDR